MLYDGTIFYATPFIIASPLVILGYVGLLPMIQRRWLTRRGVWGDKIEYASSTIACIRGSNSCIVVTEWDEFKNLKAEDFIENMVTPTVVDGRRIYDPETFGEKMGFAAIDLGNETSLKNSNETLLTQLALYEKDCR